MLGIENVMTRTQRIVMTMAGMRHQQTGHNHQDSEPENFMQEIFHNRSFM